MELQHGKNAIDAAKQVDLTTGLRTHTLHALFITLQLEDCAWARGSQEICRCTCHNHKHKHMGYLKGCCVHALQAGVSFIVFSTLEHLPQDVQDGLPKLHDGMVIPHFQSKASIEDYLRESGVPYALLLTCMFYENVINFTAYQKAEGGSYMYGDNLGTAPHGWHAVGDIGQSAAGEGGCSILNGPHQVLQMRTQRSS